MGQGSFQCIDKDNNVIQNFQNINVPLLSEEFPCKPPL